MPDSPWLHAARVLHAWRCGVWPCGERAGIAEGVVFLTAHHRFWLDEMRDPHEASLRAQAAYLERVAADG